MQNAAMLLALMWYYAGNGHGEKDMVILPYKDRLVLFSKYLQQLVMESLGKEKDLDGKVVHQGIAVYGNKGSTDQHAYVQQLRDGVPNFFVTFIEVRQGPRDRPVRSRAGRHERRLSAGIPARHARRALRKRTRLDHAQHSGGRCLSCRRADRALRARGRLLRLAREHQRLSSARRRGGQKSGHAHPAIATAGARATFRVRQKRRTRSRSRSSADPEDVFHVLRHLAATIRRFRPGATDPAMKNFRGSSSGPCATPRFARPRTGNARLSMSQAEPNIPWTEVTEVHPSAQSRPAQSSERGRAASGVPERDRRRSRN